MKAKSKQAAPKKKATSKTRTSPPKPAARKAAPSQPARAKKAEAQAGSGKVSAPPKGKRAAGRAPAAAPARSLPDAGLRLFQIYYEDWHQQLLDPAFEPYDNRGVQSELHEFAVFEKIAQAGMASGAKHWGALSWRFTEKTGMSGAQLRAAIAAKPGFDVYYCNPFPQNEALYHNEWVQGEPSHPSFLALSKAFFDAAGIPAERLLAVQPSATFSSANYFVATPAVWENYLKFVRQALGNAERRLPPKLRSLLHSKVADPKGFHFGSTYVPFIVERLFSVFLAGEPSIKAHRLALPEREKEMNVHLRLLREMKDVAHRTKSNWMVACWVNYRNLYISQTHGKEWTTRYLRSITPTAVKFA